MGDVFYSNLSQQAVPGRQRYSMKHSLTALRVKIADNVAHPDVLEVQRRRVRLLGLCGRS